jgi:hypothetical protein
MEIPPYWLGFTIDQYPMPILAKTGGDSGRVVPHAQWTVFQLEDDLSPYLSNDCEMRALGGFGGVDWPHD